jgi:NTE family protein
MARMFAARVGRFVDVFSQGLGNPLLVDGEMVLDKMLPKPLPANIEDLAAPFRAIATDYYGRSRVALASGPLRPAVAASMCIPWLSRPVRIDGRVLVDGGAVDPLPIGDADPDADIVLAIDVSGGMIADDETKFPSPIEGMLGMSSILQAALTEARLAKAAPNVKVLRAPVQEYKILDFFLARRILEVCEPLRDEVKEAVSSSR